MVKGLVEREGYRIQELKLYKFLMDTSIVAIKEIYPKCMQMHGEYLVTSVVTLKNHFTITVARVPKTGADIYLIFGNTDICASEKSFAGSCQSCIANFQLH